VFWTKAMSVLTVLIAAVKKVGEHKTMMEYITVWTYTDLSVFCLVEFDLQ